MTAIFAGTDQVKIYQAISCKCAINLHKKGIRINRHTRNKDLFSLAGSITGQTYKARDYDRAIQDLTAWIEQAKAALYGEAA